MSAFRLTKSVSHPYHLLSTTRIGVKNRYKYDYACEDEYFEKQMTMLEARQLPLPLPKDFCHAIHPDNEVQPAHWNNVRFNFLPQRQDRRAFIHDNYMNFYNFETDFAHEADFIDESMDMELPDPAGAMHFKKKRSNVTSFFGAFILVFATFAYPIMGLKIPQKDNPFYYRKKYASAGSVVQFQRIAMQEYGNAVELPPGEGTVMITQKGYQQSGGGLRYELDNYNDLIC